VILRLIVESKPGVGNRNFRHSGGLQVSGDSFPVKPQFDLAGASLPCRQV
jgi:hypothetical protein